MDGETCLSGTGREAKGCAADTVKQVKRVADGVPLCVRTSSSCCHISDLSIGFVLHVGCWDMREVRKHHERAPGGVGGALEVEEGEIPLYESCAESC